VGPTCQTPCAAPGPLGSAPLPRGCRAPRRSSALKVLPGTRVGVPTAPSRPRRVRHPPDSLAPRTTVPTVAVRSRRRSSITMPPRRSPVTVVPCYRPSAGEPPASSAVSRARWGAAVGSPCSTARRVTRACSCRVPRGPAKLGRARCAHRGQAGPSPRGRGPRTWAAPVP
jgi:hypothetical protein